MKNYLLFLNNNYETISIHYLFLPSNYWMHDHILNCKTHFQ